MLKLMLGPMSFLKVYCIKLIKGKINMNQNNFYTFSEYMKENRLTISEEDYLEMIYRLSIHKDYTRVNELAIHLNVKPPSVSVMIKRLINKNLIDHSEYGIIKLNDEGKKIGQMLLDRHNTIEKFLTLLELNENHLEETEKIEHTLNPSTIIKIKHLVTFFYNNADILESLQMWIKEKNAI